MKMVNKKNIAWPTNHRTSETMSFGWTCLVSCLGKTKQSISTQTRHTNFLLTNFLSCFATTGPGHFALLTVNSFLNQSILK